MYPTGHPPPVVIQVGIPMDGAEGLMRMKWLYQSTTHWDVGLPIGATGQ